MITKQEIYKQIKQLNDTVSDEFTELLDNCYEEELYSRGNFAGHITASGTIIHFPSHKILLLHHKTLDRWHIPGGHIEHDDQSIMAAALREIEEETGITPAELKPINTINNTVYCVEINSHLIPRNNNKNEEAHSHHDFRYVFRYNGDENIKIDDNESLDYKWIHISDPYLRQILNQPELEAMIYHEMLNYFETSTGIDQIFNEKRKMMILSKLTDIYKEIGRSDLLRQTYPRLLKITEQLVKDEGKAYFNRLAGYQYEYGKITKNTCIEEQMYLKAIKTYQAKEKENTTNNNLPEILEICGSLALIYNKSGREEMTDNLYLDMISYYENRAAGLNIKARIQKKFLSIYESSGKSEQILREIVDTYEQLSQNGAGYNSPYLAKYVAELAENIEDAQTKEKLYIKAVNIYKEFCQEYEQNYLSEIISINESLSNLYINSGRINLAETLTTETMEVYEQMAKNGQRTHLSNIAKYYETSGSRYSERDDTDTAIEMYLKAIETLEQIGDDSALIDVLETLAYIYKRCYLFSQEGDIMLKMVDVYHRLIDMNLYCYISYLANHQYAIWQRYFQQGNLEKSKQAYFEILKSSSELGEKYDDVSSLQNIDKKLIEIYNSNESSDLEEYTNPNLMEAYEYIAALFPLYYGEKIAEYQFKLGNLYFKNNETELAEKMYLAAETKFEKIYNDEYETPPAILSVIWNLSLIYENTNRYDMKLSVLNKGVKLSGYFASVDNNFISESSKFQNAVEEIKSRKLLEHV